MDSKAQLLASDVSRDLATCGREPNAARGAWFASEGAHDPTATHYLGPGIFGRTAMWRNPATGLVALKARYRPPRVRPYMTVPR